MSAPYSDEPSSQMPYGPPPGMRQSPPKSWHPGEPDQKPAHASGGWANAWQHARATGWRGGVGLAAVLLIMAVAAGTGGVAAGSSSGNKKAAAANASRDATVALATQQQDIGIAAAQKERDSAVAAADKQKQQVLDSEQPVKDAASKAKSDYETKLQSLNTESTQLGQREAAVKAREDAVGKRESAVSVAEQGLQATAFSGDGTYLVGHDILPGTYQSPGTEDGAGECYYARLSSTNTTDIIDNNGVQNGPNIVTVSPGDVALEVSGCQPFKKIG